MQIGINRRTKVLRIIQGHIYAVNIKNEPAARRPGDQRSARSGYFSVSESAVELFDLRLVGIENDRSIQIRQRDALVANQNRNRSARNRGRADNQGFLEIAGDAEREIRLARREKIARKVAENSQVNIAGLFEILTTAVTGGQ